MDDLISRQAAIDAIKNNIMPTKEGFYEPCEVFEALNEVPSAQPTLYGYNVEHLAYIARVMEKEGVTAEYAVRTFDDMGRAIKMIMEEAREKVEEALNEQFNRSSGGD